MFKILSLVAITLAGSALLIEAKGIQTKQESVPAKGDAAQEKIWSLELDYFTNLYGAEHEKVLALVHPDFLGWPDGQSKPLDREGSAAFMKKLAATPIKCQIQMERAGIKMHGNVALTQYILRAHITATDGTTTTRSSRVCHTWIKDGSDWKLLGGMSREN